DGRGLGLRHRAEPQPRRPAHDHEGQSAEEDGPPVETPLREAIVGLDSAGIKVHVLPSFSSRLSCHRGKTPGLNTMILSSCSGSSAGKANSIPPTVWVRRSGVSLPNA